LKNVDGETSALQRRISKFEFKTNLQFRLLVIIVRMPKILC